MSRARAAAPNARGDAGAEILDILRAVLPEDRGPYALHEPELTAVERAAVDEALAEGYVSYSGRHVAAFEAALAELCGCGHAVAVSSGTVAIQLALHALGVGPGDEVLCPALTFVATANAVSHVGALPHFVDSGADDLAIDPERLAARLAAVAERSAGGARNRETGRRIAALVPVHILGHVGRLDALASVAADWGLPLVEDAAQAIGSRDAAGRAFRAGSAATLSFNGNKTVTTGGGGAILTDDGALAARLRHLATTAKLDHPWRYEHDAVAFNARLPALNAALGAAQLARLPDMLVRKRALAERYRGALSRARRWRWVGEPPGARSNFWLGAAALDEPDAATLDAALAAAHAAGYRCRPCWTPMHVLPMYRDAPRAALPVAEALAARILCLPSSARLGGEPADG